MSPARTGPKDGILAAKAGGVFLTGNSFPAILLPAGYFALRARLADFRPGAFAVSRIAPGFSPA